MAESNPSARGVPPPNDGPSEGRDAFPTTEEEFKNDVRVSFDKTSEKWILENDDGVEYEWNPQFEKWVPSVDEVLMQQQASIYAMKDVDETAPAIDSKKRKADIKATKQDKKTKIERPNSAVYVTGIPLDTNIDEIHDVFKKYGIIEEDIHTNLPKIRMYADDEGNFKGEAKVIYFKPQSVSLAITMLDGTDFRKPGDGDLHVELVDDSYSNRNKDPAAQKEKKEVSVENIRKRRPKQDRYLAIEKTKQMNARLADWDDDDPSVVAPPPNPSKYAKIVVLKHMFTLEELEEDAGALIEIKADIRDEASKYGEVTNTVLYDLEPQGVVTVRFKEPDSAVLCAEAFNGRWFDKRKVIAYVPQHREDFAKSKGSGQDGLQDIDEEEPDDDDDEKERVSGSAVEGHRTIEAEKETDPPAKA